MGKFSQRIYKMSTAAVIILCTGFVFISFMIIIAYSMKKTSTSPSPNVYDVTNWSPWAFTTYSSTAPIQLDTAPMNYKSYKNYSVNPVANIGSPVPNKNASECQILCGNTENCTGFITTGGNCQLVNNVSILERSEGDTIFASQDIGATKYMHVPYKPINNVATPKMLYQFSGQLGEAVSDCSKKENNCGAFTSNITGYDMYPTIVAVDSTVSGDTYSDPNIPLKLIREGNFNYNGSPDLSWKIDNTKIMPTPTPTFTKDMDFFNLWGKNWDASQDNKGPLNLISGVSGPDYCSNLCMSNTWCQSFVVGKGNEDGSCWLRHDPDEDNKCFTGWSCPPPSSLLQPAGWCLDSIYCGSDNPADCGGTRQYGSCATNSSTRDTYYKYQYPIDIQCPMKCYTDGDCQLATYKTSTGECNQYNSPVPRLKTVDSSMNSVWNADNFPG